VLLVYFFITIGINARISDLIAGGRPLLILLLSVSVFLLLQNAVGVGAAALLGGPPAVGVLAGSVSMMGGHGTAVAWAPLFAEQFGIANALEVGAVSATAGLVMASLLGGPLARHLVNRYRLEGQNDDAPEVGVDYREAPPPIDYNAFLQSLLMIHISGVIGILLHQALASTGLTLPLFVPCLVAGMVITNLRPHLVPRLPWSSRTPALAVIAEVSLGVFLAMSLMSMQLWALADLAGPLAVILLLQAVLIVAFARFVTFPALGRSYDAAVICAGLIGFGLGATPTAMANMTAVTQRHGASHVAFLVVPLVGAFFIDLVNTVVIRLALSVL
jgi:ESS family glutamate:Na+ symporter